jgi:peptidoglycan LD-endopeptidase CwlK
MGKLSERSTTNLALCNKVLVNCVHKVLPSCNVGVTFGHRNETEQHKLFVAGKSQLDWPDSKHNTMLSEAVDLVIYHPKYGYLYGDAAHLATIANAKGELVETVRIWFYMQYARLDTLMNVYAAEQGATLRWGGKWSNPDDLIGNSLIDVFHWEILHE